MNFLHTDFSIGPRDMVVVTLDAQANVMLMDDQSYAGYQRGLSFEYVGGWAPRTPVRLSPPCYGHWHVVVDLGGRAGQVRAGVRVLRGAEVAQAC
jgi:hypothetical protein